MCDSRKKGAESALIWRYFHPYRMNSLEMATTFVHDFPILKYKYLFNWLHRCVLFGRCIHLSGQWMQKQAVTTWGRQQCCYMAQKWKSIRNIAETLGMPNSTVWFIINKKKTTDELNYVKRPGKQKTAAVDDRRIFCDEKKAHENGPTDLKKNTILDAGVDASKSTIHGRLDQQDYKITVC